jgi:hypothetical protein
MRAGDTHTKSWGVSFSSQLFAPIREGLKGVINLENLSGVFVISPKDYDVR